MELASLFPLVTAILLAGCGKQPPARPKAPVNTHPSPVSAIPLPHFNPDRSDHQHIAKALRQALSQPQGPVAPKALERVKQLGQLSLTSRQIVDLRPMAGLKELRELWLMGNHITNIQALTSLTKLRSLWLHGNQVADLTPIQDLRSLRELVLSANRIRDLTSLVGPPQLEALHLSGNKITRLEPLSRFTRLRTLDLSSNRITDPRGLERCLSLENLNLGHNKVTNLNVLRNLTVLKTLTLDNNPVHDLANLAPCRNLESLSVPSTGISSLTPLAQARALRELNLANNRISSLEALTGLAALEKLNVTHNPLASLAGLKSCHSLRRLEGSFNLTGDLAPLAQLQKLEEIHLNGNPVADLTPLAGLGHLHTLHLSHGRLTRLDALTKLVRLRQLDLSHNDLADLSPLARLTALHRLNLSFNTITNTTPLATLTNLTELHLKGNRIVDLAPLASIRHLIHLDLAANQITNLAPLAGLKYLQSLYLNHNRATRLEGLEGCTRLAVLTLEGNPVTDLAPLAELTGLRRLYLDASAAPSLAPLAGLTNLVRLEYSGQLASDQVAKLRKALPKCAIQQVGLTVKTPEAEPGYVLLAPISATSTFLINRDGRVVHEWPSLYRPHLAVYLMEDGSLLRTCAYTSARAWDGAPAIPGGGLQRISWEGRVLWDCHEFKVHHDIEPLPNGNLLAIVNETVSTQDAVTTGRDPATIGDEGLMPDVILEIQPTGPRGGKIVWEWHAWDHVVQDLDPDKKNFGAVGVHHGRLDLNHLGVAPSRNIHDWLHLNSIDYHPLLDQILLSCHRFNEIWIIDHATTTAQAKGPQGRLLYRWGNPEAYKTGNEGDRQLFRQHDAQWLPDGHILLFNNGQRRIRPYSSVDEINPPLDPDGHYPRPNGQPFGPARPIWTYTAPRRTDFYSRNISGAQRLPNGHTLVCSGAPGRIFEIDQAGKIVWEYRNPHHGLPGGQWGGQPGRRSPRHAGGNRPVFRAAFIAPDHPALKGKTFNRLHSK